MKKLLIASSILLISTAFAGRDVAPGPNQCSPVMDSKVYLTSDFHAYPRKVVFECSYKCNVNNKIETIKGVSSVVVSNMEQDASDTTCQGVMMKRVPWGYDFDKVVPFYAPETAIKEIKRWSFQNINFDPKVNSQELQKLTTLKDDLNKIAGSLIVAGMNSNNHFKEAGIKLSQIAEGLPLNTKLLDETIKMIVVNKGTSAVPGTPESLIYQMINSAASWRIPSHNF